MNVSPENLIALAIGVLAALGAVLAKMLWRRESIEDRLQRWQSETVKRVSDRADQLEAEVMRLRLVVARVTHLELGLKLAVDEVARLDPGSRVLVLLHDVLTVAYPVEAEAPEDIAALLRQFERPGG
jgi:hypothetical protein